MAQILIIEDDDSMRCVLKDMLERQNYDVMVASDGAVKSFLKTGSLGFPISVE